MKIYTLEADRDLVKSFGANGVSAYPMAYAFTSHCHDVNTISEFYRLVQSAADQNHCLIKGQLHRELVQESRAGATTASDQTEWVCFDLDKTSIKKPDDFMTMIGLADVSYVVQYSSSYGVLSPQSVPYSDRLSCHIFVLLDQPAAAPLLKQWLYQLNFAFPDLEKDLTLTNSRCALHYPLDVTTCQSDKLLYIAPPICKDGWTDALGRDRIKLVKKKLGSLTLPCLINSPEQNRSAIDHKINALRSDMGLPRRRQSNYKFFETVEVLDKPDVATLSGIKQERGFVYLNLNGGNSWGYYHPEDNHEVIYNFKGEPNYLTKQLLPDYYAELEGARAKLTRAQKQEAARGCFTTGDGFTLFAFREMATDCYFNGWLTPTDDLTIHPVSSKDKLEDFLAQYGLAMPDVLPDWELKYDPTQVQRFDADEQWLNRYQPGKIVPAAGEWPTIARVIRSALGVPHDTEAIVDEHEELYQHFLKWISWVYVKGKQAGTAWVLHGTQGTGKGVLLAHVLTPLLGEGNTQQILMHHLEERFNGWMETSQIVWVDEVHMSQLLKAKETNARLKSWITEPVITIEAKYSNAKRARSFLNWIFASNMPDPVLIDPNDRRFNVGFYQKDTLKLDEADIEAIARELPAFAQTLSELKVVEQDVRTVLSTSARQDMIRLNRTGPELAFDALRDGELNWFMEQVPDSAALLGPLELNALDTYLAALHQAMTEADKGHNISREVAQKLIEYTTGEKFQSPNQFTRKARLHRVEVKPVKQTGVVMRGLLQHWRRPSFIPALLDQFLQR